MIPFVSQIRICCRASGGLFSTDEEDLFQSPAPTTGKASSIPSAPPVREPTTESPGEDDLFATPKNPGNSVAESADSKSAPKANNSAGLFDAIEGSSDEDNLFNPRPLAKQSLFSAVPPPLNKSEDRPKKVSLFDDSDSGDDEFLFSSASSAGSRRSQASVDIYSSSSALPTEKKPPKKGLFDDDLFGAPVHHPSNKRPLKKGLFDDDNLFSAPGDGPSVPPPTEKRPVKKGLFDDDDLFSAPVDGVSVPSSAEKSLKKGLFDGDSLFSAPADGASGPPPAEKSLKKGLFDGDSLFSAPADGASGPPPVEKSLRKGLFDDDSLFSAPVDGASSPPPAGKSLKKGLFDGDSVFSAPVDGASSPPPARKSLKKGLFDDDSLFSDPVDGPEVDIFRDAGDDNGLGATNTVIPPALSTAKTASPVVSSAAMSTNSIAPVVASEPVGGVATHPASPAVVPSLKPGTPVGSSCVTDLSSDIATSTKSVSSAATGMKAASSGASSSASADKSAVTATQENTNSVSTSAVPAPTAVPGSATPEISAIKGTAGPPASTATSAVPSTRATSTGSAGDSLLSVDEDLFSVSKPPPLHKPPNKHTLPPVNKFSSAATDLFSGLGTETKDLNSKADDDLFGDLPEDDLFANSKIPSRVSLMIDNNPKVPVDDLFGTDEGDGDIFVPKKPTLTISDSVFESVETVKEVPTAIEIPKQKLKPDLKPTPPRTLDIRNTTDPNVISSFDADEDEDLFKPPSIESKPAPVNRPPVPVEGKRPPQSQKPVMPAEAEQPKSVPLPPKPVPAARKPNVSTPGNEGAKAEERRSPEVQPQPATRPTMWKDEENAPMEQSPFAQLPTPAEKSPGPQLPSQETPVSQPPLMKMRTPLAGTFRIVFVFSMLVSCWTP